MVLVQNSKKVEKEYPYRNLNYFLNAFEIIITITSNRVYGRLRLEIYPLIHFIFFYLITCNLKTYRKLLWKFNSKFQSVWFCYKSVHSLCTYKFSIIK